MKHQVGQSQATKQLTEGPSITVQEMADSMGDRLHEMVVKEKEKRQRKRRKCTWKRIVVLPYSGPKVFGETR